MVKYLLVAFSFLTIVSCSTETYEEYLVETNENLFPKGYFSYQYFDIGVTTFRWTQKLSLHAVSLENEKE